MTPIEKLKALESAQGVGLTFIMCRCAQQFIALAEEVGRQQETPEGRNCHSTGIWRTYAALNAAIEKELA